MSLVRVVVRCADRVVNYLSVGCVVKFIVRPVPPRIGFCLDCVSITRYWDLYLNTWRVNYIVIGVLILRSRMNIFVLSLNPYVCALYHCDKHVVKMILEYAQILSTAHRVLDGVQVEMLSDSGRRLKRWIHRCEYMDKLLYKSTHTKHPCVQWVLEGSENYMWLYSLMIHLMCEYRIRYGRVHLTEKKLSGVLFNIPENIRRTDKMTKPALAMPDEYKCEDVVLSYRLFYKYSKVRFAVWKDEGYPWWMD